MKKILFIAFVGLAKLCSAQTQPTDVQIKYALTVFGKSLKAHNLQDIGSMLDENFHVAEFRDQNLKNVLPQLINPVQLDTVYYGQIIKKNDRIYAQQTAVPKSGPKMVSWVRLNKYLMFERIGHFEQLMGMADPIAQELLPAKLLSTVPIQRSSGMMFVQISIDAKVYDFLFDSGAGATSINKELAEKLNLKASQNKTDIKTAGNGGSFKTIDTLNMSLGGVKVLGKQAVIADLTGLQNAVGHKMDGIIGFDLLKDYQVSVNLDNSKMDIYSFGDLKDSYKNVLPITLSGNIPKVDVVLNVNDVDYKTRFTFDSGAGGAIYGNYFLNAYTLGLIDKLKNKSSSASMDLSGAVSKSEVGMVNSISVAGLKVKNPTVALDLPAEQSPYGFTQHGLMGMAIIGKFNILFNYSLGFIAISPNKTFDTPLIPLYALGLGFQKDGDKFVAKSVDEKGLAYQAGLRKGDELLKINNITPESIDQITQQLRTLSKNKVPLEVNRNQQKIKIELKKFDI